MKIPIKRLHKRRVFTFVQLIINFCEFFISQHEALLPFFIKTTGKEAGKAELSYL
jgi:hypothetical protein